MFACILICNRWRKGEALCELWRKSVSKWGKDFKQGPYITVYSTHNVDGSFHVWIGETHLFPGGLKGGGGGGGLTGLQPGRPQYCRLNPPLPLRYTKRRKLDRTTTESASVIPDIQPEMFWTITPKLQRIVFVLHCYSQHGNVGWLAAKAKHM